MWNSAVLPWTRSGRHRRDRGRRDRGRRDRGRRDRDDEIGDNVSRSLSDLFGSLSDLFGSLWISLSIAVVDPMRSKTKSTQGPLTARGSSCCIPQRSNIRARFMRSLGIGLVKPDCVLQVQSGPMSLAAAQLGPVTRDHPFSGYDHVGAFHGQFVRLLGPQGLVQRGRRVEDRPLFERLGHHPVARAPA